MNGSNAFAVLLKLNPRKYKYNAYSIVSADILSRSNKLTEYRRISKAIVLSKLTGPYRTCPLYNFRAKFDEPKIVFAVCERRSL